MTPQFSLRENCDVVPPAEQDETAPAAVVCFDESGELPDLPVARPWRARRSGSALGAGAGGGLGQTRDLARGGLLVDDALGSGLVDDLDRGLEQLGELAVLGLDGNTHALD